MSREIDNGYRVNETIKKLKELHVQVCESVKFRIEASNALVLFTRMRIIFFKPKAN